MGGLFYVVLRDVINAVPYRFCYILFTSGMVLWYNIYIKISQRQG